MKKFFFSFGTDPMYPFTGGYIIIEAENIRQACDVFKAYFPNREGSDALNCAFYYTEKEFMKHWKDVWCFEKCHEHISRWKVGGR